MPSQRGSRDERARRWLGDVLHDAVPDATRPADGHERAVRRIVHTAFQSLPLADQDALADLADDFFEPVKMHWRDHAQGRIGELFTGVPGGQQIRAKVKEWAVSCGTTSLLSLIAVGLAAGYFLSRGRASPVGGASTSGGTPAAQPGSGPAGTAESRPVFAIFGALWDDELAAGLLASLDQPISEALAIGLRRAAVVWRVGAPVEIEDFDPLFRPTAGSSADEYDWLYVKIELPRMDARLGKDAGEHARCAAVDGLAVAGALIRRISARVPNRLGAELDFWRFQ